MEGDGSAHIAVGCVALLFPIICVPCYMRIIYIFLANKSYRKLECYRIMIQMGIAQCLMGPSWVFTGIAHLIEFDPLGLASFCYKLTGCFVRTEAVLSLLLALDRFRTICGLRYPQAFHSVINIVAWLVSVIQLGVLLSPFADFYVNPLNFRPTYDYSKPYSRLLQKTGSLLLLGIFSTTLLLYVAIVSYLINHQFKAKITSVRREKAILTYAFVRFVADFSAALLYHFGPNFLPHTCWVDIGVFFSYPHNHLLLPLVLYLSLYKSIRNDFFGKNKEIVPLISIAGSLDQRSAVKAQLEPRGPTV